MSILAFSPDGTLLATATDDGTIRIWDLATSRECAHLDGDDAKLYAGWFSPDAKSLATTSVNGILRVRDWATPHDHTNIDSQIAWLRQVPCPPSLDLLAAAKGNGAAKVLAHAWSADCTLLAAVKDDGTAKIWMKHGERLVNSVRMGHSCHAVAFAPSGLSVAVAVDNDWAAYQLIAR